MDPQVPQCNLQLWDVEWLLPLYLVNYEIPDILNRVEVGKIVMSVYGVYVLLFKPLLHLLCLMSCSTITIMDRPEGEQMVFQYAIEVSFCIVTFLVGSVDHLYHIFYWSHFIPSENQGVSLSL